jgi:hypothetical protein
MTTRLSTRDNSVGFSNNEPQLYDDAGLHDWADDSLLGIERKVKSIINEIFSRLNPMMRELSMKRIATSIVSGDSRF